MDIRFKSCLKVCRIWIACDVVSEIVHERNIDRRCDVPWVIGWCGTKNVGDHLISPCPSAIRSHPIVESDVCCSLFCSIHSSPSRDIVPQKWYLVLVVGRVRWIYNEVNRFMFHEGASPLPGVVPLLCLINPTDIITGYEVKEFFQRGAGFV